MTVPISSTMVSHTLILGFEAESVSCRISNLLQSLDPQLPCLDSTTVGLRLGLGIIIFFRGYIPHAILLHQARISKTSICPVHRKPTADAADPVCAKIPNHVSILLFSMLTYCRVRRVRCDHICKWLAAPISQGPLFYPTLLAYIIAYSAVAYFLVYQIWRFVHSAANLWWSVT